ncbi:MAG: ABC transporter permease subunit [Pseudobacteriovorax sp.]|nr:ABC transporter permease subunit [Pseudobacteriovorax sp.]
MKNFIPITQETFVRLRRDRIFLPASIAGIGLIILSAFASYWGVEEFFKILYDLGTTVYHFTGATVAIFWGIKIIQDSRQEGSLEVQLASPVGRSEWLLAKYTGLATALGSLAVLFICGWQCVYFAYGMGWMGWNQFGIFALLTLSWLVVGASSILMSIMATYAVALFASFWLFAVGLLTAPLMQSMAPDTPQHIRQFINSLAGLWNLHYFNLFEIGANQQNLDPGMIGERLAYATALIGFCLGLGAFIFRKKDLAN